MEAHALPLLLVGAGQMGGALIAGWRLRGVVPASSLLIRDPAPGVEALSAAEAGARLDPTPNEIAGARTVVLAVKPQSLPATAADLEPLIASDALVVSVVAGVSAQAVARRFGGRPVARVMPTMAAAVGKGAFSIWAADAAARERVHALFAPLGMAVDLADEDHMHAATAACGSGPAYVYAFIEALERAGRRVGLPDRVSRDLARATLLGAAAMLETTGADPAHLREQVTSPGGTTAAGLAVLDAPEGLADLLERAVAAAVARSRVLGSAP